jgi:excisionase family DNA binding protein
MEFHMSDELEKLPDMMIPSDIAQFMRVNERTVRTWIESKELPAFPIGKRGYRISKTDFRDFIERRKQRGINDGIDTK